jgi:hypothetical protein
VLVHSNEVCGAGGPGGFEIYNVGDTTETGYGNFHIYDITDPTAPVLVSHRAPPQHCVTKIT